MVVKVRTQMIKTGWMTPTTRYWCYMPVHKSDLLFGKVLPASPSQVTGHAEIDPRSEVKRQEQERRGGVAGQRGTKVSIEVLQIHWTYNGGELWLNG